MINVYFIMPRKLGDICSLEAAILKNGFTEPFFKIAASKSTYCEVATATEQ